MQDAREQNHCALTPTSGLVLLDVDRLPAGPPSRLSAPAHALPVYDDVQPSECHVKEKKIIPPAKTQAKISYNYQHCHGNITQYMHMYINQHTLR